MSELIWGYLTLEQLLVRTIDIQEKMESHPECKEELLKDLRYADDLIFRALQ